MSSTNEAKENSEQAMSFLGDNKRQSRRVGSKRGRRRRRKQTSKSAESQEPQKRPGKTSAEAADTAAADTAAADTAAADTAAADAAEEADAVEEASTPEKPPQSDQESQPVAREKKAQATDAEAGGAKEDGAKEDGAKEDGAKEDRADTAENTPGGSTGASQGRGVASTQASQRSQQQASPHAGGLPPKRSEIGAAPARGAEEGFEERPLIEGEGEHRRFNMRAPHESDVPWDELPQGDIGQSFHRRKDGMLFKKVLGYIRPDQQLALSKEAKKGKMTRSEAIRAALDAFGLYESEELFGL